MPPPRRTKVQRPSPLQQVHSTRDLAQAPPGYGLVRDPAFWKRFSTAVHISEIETGLKSAASSVEMKYGDDWLAQQHKEKRRCRILFAGIALTVSILIVAIVLVLYYFLKVRK